MKAGAQSIARGILNNANVGCKTQKYVTSILAGEVWGKGRGIVKNCEGKMTAAPLSMKNSGATDILRSYC
jgi:hypothetical protein